MEKLSKIKYGKEKKVILIFLKKFIWIKNSKMKKYIKKILFKHKKIINYLIVEIKYYK